MIVLKGVIYMKKICLKSFAAVMGTIFIISACFLDTDLIPLPIIICIISGIFTALYGYANGWCCADEPEDGRISNRMNRSSVNDRNGADIIAFRKSSVSSRLLDA